MEFLARTLQVVQPALECLLIILLLNRSLFRKYLMVFLFCVLLLVTSLAEVLVVQWIADGTRSDIYRILYWTDEIVTDAFLFIMVAVMIYRATEGTPLRKLAERLFSGVVTIALLLPFVLFDKPFSNHWYNRSSQLLNFGGAILNLLLWTALLGMRRRDTQLLTVSAGLGVIVTGSAVFYGLLATFSKEHPELTPLLNLGYVLSRCAGLAIWCWAFWRIRKAEPAALAAPQVLETPANLHRDSAPSPDRP